MDRQTHSPKETEPTKPKLVVDSRTGLVGQDLGELTRGGKPYHKVDLVEYVSYVPPEIFSEFFETWSEDWDNENLDTTKGAILNNHFVGLLSRQFLSWNAMYLKKTDDGRVHYDLGTVTGKPHYQLRLKELFDYGLQGNGLIFMTDIEEGDEEFEFSIRSRNSGNERFRGVNYNIAYCTLKFNKATDVDEEALNQQYGEAFSGRYYVYVLDPRKIIGRFITFDRDVDPTDPFNSYQRDFVGIEEHVGTKAIICALEFDVNRNGELVTIHENPDYHGQI